MQVARGTTMPMLDIVTVLVGTVTVVVDTVTVVVGKAVASNRNIATATTMGIHISKHK